MHTGRWEVLLCTASWTLGGPCPHEGTSMKCASSVQIKRGVLCRHLSRCDHVPWHGVGAPELRRYIAPVSPGYRSRQRGMDINKAAVACLLVIGRNRQGRQPCGAGSRTGCVASRRMQGLCGTYCRARRAAGPPFPVLSNRHQDAGGICVSLRYGRSQYNYGFRAKCEHQRIVGRWGTAGLSLFAVCTVCAAAHCHVC